MKGYYKNWYQHYLEVEAKKEQDMKRGYYSNLTTEEQVPNREKSEAQSDKSQTIIQATKTKDKKKKNHFLNFFLPVVTLVGFIFFWYQADIGPTRELVNEVLVLTGMREPAVDVVGHHTSLLEEHSAFSEKILTFLNDDGEVSLSELEQLFDYLQEKHVQIAEVSNEVDTTVLKLWSSKIANIEEIMTHLITGDQIDMLIAYEKFILEQAEIASMIMTELSH